METDREFSNVVEIREFPGRSIVTRRNTSDDPDQATGETVERMTAAAIEDCSSVPVWLATKEAIGRPGAQASLTARAVAIHNWIAGRVKFRHDDPVLSVLLGLDNELDLLIRPARLLTMGRPAEDCDGFTMLACAMLLCAGVPCEIVTIKADPGEPGRFSHVYCQAIVEDGRALVLDCSQAAQHGYPAGWEAPGYFDRRTWGVMYPPEKGLHGLNDLNGMGDEICDIFGCYPGSSSGTAPAPSSSGGFDWNAIIGNSFKLASQLALRPGQYIQTAGGVMANQVPGAIPGQYPGAGINLGGGFNSTTILVGGAVLLGIVLLAKGK